MNPNLLEKYAEFMVRVGVNVQFLAAACGQLLKVVPRQPLAPTTHGLLLRFVAVVPNVIDRARLTCQLAVAGVAQAKTVG